MAMDGFFICLNLSEPGIFYYLCPPCYENSAIYSPEPG